VIGAKLIAYGTRQLGEAMDWSETMIRSLEVASGIARNIAGGVVAARGVSWFNSRYQITTQGLGSNFGNARITSKLVSLPAWKKIGIDMGHIASGHMKGGTRVSSRKNLFPENMSTSQVRRTIRQAYRYCKRAKSQGDRVLVHSNGIEMWVNTNT